jgi:hypothetical protein
MKDVNVPPHPPAYKLHRYPYLGEFIQIEIITLQTNHTTFDMWPVS